ncbi:MAG: penicillin-binding protein [Betaproteobacteria bacterium RIFCSPLOWO2_02_FULL_67_26]|nr:MAG: penicillin-binding protein [Betaproteobacteria bacterium RIFCSPLOWO2_02_FULL_67_26]
MSIRWLTFPLVLLLSGLLAGVMLVAFAAALVYPGLPSLDALTDYQPKIPLRVYSADGKLIGEFGEERRAVVRIQDVPKPMVDAILAAEDERFYQHGGVDYVGVARAALSNFLSGGVRQGASTITMQVARNFFLSKEKTLTRKFNEMLLAFKIEANLSKAQILELYVNQIYLGHRAYGFAAAAQIYFGKRLPELTLAESALLAGLPKAPSRFNPITNPKRAKFRQQYVLRRMRELQLISEEAFAAADQQPVVVKKEINEYPVHAEHFAEMVRQALYDRYQEDTYAKGLRVYTTLLTSHQEAAYMALRRGVQEYDRRHGYRGPESYVELPDKLTDEALEDALQDAADSDDMHAAVVAEANPTRVKAYRKGGEWVEIKEDGLKFAARRLGDKVNPGQRIRRGAIIRVQKDEKKRWQITQLPAVESSLVALDPRDGAIRALVGGYDFSRNQFNHVTQALRQPGSSFKPFIYSAALEKGFTPATVVNDAPLTFTAAETGSEPWEPKNFDGKFEGPMRLRTALVKSKNLVSVRILQAISPQYAQDYVARFGFDPKLHPPYLTMALGAGNVTPMQMAAAYSIFANGGHRIAPYFIERVEDARGNVLVTAQPAAAGSGAERVIDARNAFIMSSILRDVVRMGTGARAMKLGRGDLAGKTGTTNEFVDAWFCGFNAGLAAVAWIGFDTPQTLGRNETGAQAALPIWMGYMGAALKGVPEQPLAPPAGIVAMNVNPDTGLRVAEGGLVDYFYHEFSPPAQETLVGGVMGGDRPREEVRNQLF